MELRRISSLLTPVAKFLVPVGIAWAFVNSFFLWGRQALQVMDWPFYVFTLVGMVVVAAFELWLSWPIKRVMLDVANRRLYVSNYRREIAIPFSEIERISEFKLHNPPRLTLHLRTPTEFGSQISFLTTYRPFTGFWTTHPIVKELRSLIDAD